MLKRGPAWLGRRTATQLAAGMGVLAALALAGSLFVTGAAVRADQRQQAALAALDDYGAMVEKLGAEISLTGGRLTEADAAFLSAWLSAFQSGPTREIRSLEETCRTGRGGAGLRFIRGPVGKPAGLAVLETAAADPIPRLGEGVHVIRLDRGLLCPARAVEAVVVKRRVGALEVIVGRVVDPPGAAWALAVGAVAGLGLLLLGIGLGAAAVARRRLTGAVREVSAALDRAAVGDFSVRAPATALAPELTDLTGRVNATLDRLEELVRWMRDSADQMAHDFRTPLARASTRLDRLAVAATETERRALTEDAREDLARLSRSMTEALALRDGDAWTFEAVALDELARQVHDLYEPLAEERGVKIVLDVEPASVLGVRSLLQRAVANLADNALKFSPTSGTVMLSVRREGDGAWLRVSDQGSGFDPQALISPAEMVASHQRAGRDSHAMGLAFVQAVLRRHGGGLTIDDGKPGAVVTARFPR